MGAITDVRILILARRQAGGGGRTAAPHGLAARVAALRRAATAMGQGAMKGEGTAVVRGLADGVAAAAAGAGRRDVADLASSLAAFLAAADGPGGRPDDRVKDIAALHADAMALLLGEAADAAEGSARRLSAALAGAVAHVLGRIG